MPATKHTQIQLNSRSKSPTVYSSHNVQYNTPRPGYDWINLYGSGSIKYSELT